MGLRTPYRTEGVPSAYREGVTGKHGPRRVWVQLATRGAPAAAMSLAVLCAREGSGSGSAEGRARRPRPLAVQRRSLGQGRGAGVCLCFRAPALPWCSSGEALPTGSGGQC